MNMDKVITYILEYVANHDDGPEIYNDTANLLYNDFKIVGAETCLLCMYVILKYKGAREDEEKRNREHITGKGNKGKAV